MCLYANVSGCWRVDHTSEHGSELQDHSCAALRPLYRQHQLLPAVQVRGVYTCDVSSRFKPLRTSPLIRAALAKEKKLLSHLAAIMRYGCEEADRVQHYW